MADRQFLVGSVTQSLIRQALLQFESEVPRALPVPRFREIGAGFDAILQFRSDLLERTFADHLETFGYDNLIASMDFDPSILTEDQQERIERELYVAEQPPPLGLEQSNLARRGRIDLVPERYEVRFRRPTLDLRPGDPPTATVRWGLGLQLVGIETDASFRQRQRELAERDPAFAERLRPLTIPVFLARGTATVHSVPIVVQVFGVRFQAGLDFSGREAVIETPDPLFRHLLSRNLADRIQGQLEPILGGTYVAYQHRDITPLMSLGGRMGQFDTLEGLGAVRVTPVVTDGNDLDHRVLSLCVDISRPGREGAPDLVQPFVADRNFAYYVTEPIIRAVLRHRWNQADTPKVLTDWVTVTVPDPDDQDNTVEWRARVEVTFEELRRIRFAPGSGRRSDPLRLTGRSRIHLLRVLDHRGREIPHDRLGDLARPYRKPFSVRVYLFEEDADEDESRGEAFLKRIARRLLPPLYRPTSADMHIRDVGGRTSSALGAMYIRGNLG